MHLFVDMMHMKPHYPISIVLAPLLGATIGYGNGFRPLKLKAQSSNLAFAHCAKQLAQSWIAI